MKEYEFTAEEKIKHGIINLQKPQPFFAHLLMALKVKEMPKEWFMQTMGINGKGEMFFNRDYAMKLSVGRMSGTIGSGASVEEKFEPGEMEGVICHEVLHVALAHFDRLGGREPEIANIAEDVVVNYIVKKNRMPLPEGCVPVDVSHDTSDFEIGTFVDGKGKSAHVHIEDVSKKPWEQVYNEIVGQLQQQGISLQQAKQGIMEMQKNGNGKLGKDMHDRSFDNLTDEEKKKVRDKWVQRLTDAATYAKQQGHLPEGIERFVDELVKPKVSWKEYLRRYVKQFSNPVDWAYNRPAKRSYALDMYLPNIIKEEVEIEVLVDTSGSIGKNELTEFVSEIVAMARAMSHLKMTVTFIDCEVQARYPVENGSIHEIMRMEPKGGGGTSMEKGLDYIKEHNPQIPVVVVLTDGCDSWYKKRIDYPFEVLWCITEGGITDLAAIPYGLKIKMGE